MTNSSKSDKPTPSSNLRIRRERELRSWSQEDLAEKVGTTALTVSRWERGAVFPSPYYRQRLCETLGKTPQELGFVTENSKDSSDIQQAPPAPIESHAEGTPLMPSVREEVTVAPSEKSVSVTHRALPLFSKRNLLLLGGIILLLAVSGSGIFYFVKKAVSVPLPVYALATGTTQPPSPPIGTTYPPRNAKLVLNDALLDNSRGYNWDERGSCSFTGDGYHIALTVKHYIFYCNAFTTNFSNFVYEAQMTILKGDSGGLIFRANADNAMFYYFTINQNGHYLLLIFAGHSSRLYLADGTSSAFHTGPHQPNLIAAFVTGNHIDLYVNHKRTAAITDSTYSQGQIGLAAGTGNGGPVDVVFTNAKVWQL